MISFTCPTCRQLPAGGGREERGGWWWVGGAACVVTRVPLPHFAGPIKIAITRWTVHYTYVRRLIALGRFASDQSCFKCNIRDAMPSICYDDDSANEKNHRGNRRNCIDAAPFPLWLVTSSSSLFFFFSFLFFFPSYTHRHRRSYRSIVIVAPGFYEAHCVTVARDLVGGIAGILKATTVRDHGPRLLSLDVGPIRTSYRYIPPAARHKAAFFSRGCTAD